MQIASLQIWIQVTSSISYDGNHYAMCGSYLTIYVFTNLSGRAGCETRSIFKQNFVV